MNFSRNTMRTLFTAAISVLALAAGALPAQAADVGHVIGYYALSSGSKDIDKIPWQSLTVLNVAFIGIDAQGKCAWMNMDGKGGPDEVGAEDAVRAVVAARNANNPQVKVVLSVGGWTMSGGFSKATSTTAGSIALAKSCVAVAKDLQLDGVDYDWEYPTRLGAQNCPEGEVCASKYDTDNFPFLLLMTRALLPPGQFLSVATYYDPTKKGIPYKVAQMDPFLDTWNVMAYDITAPSWQLPTGYHAGIQTSIAALESYAQQGASRNKLVMGVPYYGYTWHGVQAADVGSAAPRKSSGRQRATEDLLAQYANDPGCSLTLGDEGDVYYCASGPSKGDWTAIDTQRVLRKKTQLVRDRGFAGMMMWEVQFDSTGALTDILMQAQKPVSNVSALSL